MHIQFDNFNIPKMSLFKNSAKISNTIGFCGLKKDTFEKTQKVDLSNKTILKKDKIVQMYNETIAEVKKQNPLYKKLGIKKPNLVFEYSDNEAFAHYSFHFNTIKVNEKYLDKDFYLVSVETENGIKVPLGILPDDMAHDEMVELKKDECFKNAELEKLNEDEKEIWYKGILAHELRHCIQENLVASDVNCSREFLTNKKVTFANYIIALQDALQLKEENGERDTEEYKAFLDDLNWAKAAAPLIFDFKPKKMVARDRLLPFSVFKDKKMCFWSTKNHFMKAQENYGKEESVYLSSPLEIDAMHYQDEFLADLYEKNKGKCRHEIAYGMLQGLRANYRHGLRSLMDNGYEPLM